MGLHLLLADPVESVGDEGTGQQRLGLVGSDSPAFQVEERISIELADGRAMGAFDIVGEDFELRLGVDRGAARKQDSLQRLLAVGLLGVARDLDPGGSGMTPNWSCGIWCRRA